MTIEDNTQIKWTTKLKDDLRRINKCIKEERQKVDVGIQNLKDLHKARELVLAEALEAEEDKKNDYLIDNR